MHALHVPQGYYLRLGKFAGSFLEILNRKPRQPVSRATYIMSYRAYVTSSGYVGICTHNIKGYFSEYSVAKSYQNYSHFWRTNRKLLVNFSSFMK